MFQSSTSFHFLRSQIGVLCEPFKNKTNWLIPKSVPNIQNGKLRTKIVRLAHTKKRNIWCWPSKPLCSVSHELVLMWEGWGEWLSKKKKSCLLTFNYYINIFLSFSLGLLYFIILLGFLFVVAFLGVGGVGGEVVSYCSFSFCRWIVFGVHISSKMTFPAPYMLFFQCLCVCMSMVGLHMCVYVLQVIISKRCFAYICMVWSLRILGICTGLPYPRQSLLGVTLRYISIICDLI